MALTLKSSETLLRPTSHEVLTDEQIENLLQDAEARLRAKAGLSVQKVESDDVLQLESDAVRPTRRLKFPRLEHDLDRSTYIKNENGVAKTSANLTVPTEQRKMAEELRALPAIDSAGKRVVRTFDIQSPLQEEILSQIFS